MLPSVLPPVSLMKLVLSGTRYVTLTTAALTLLLSSCAITPTPLSDAEIRETVDARLGAVLEKQQPIDGPITLYEAMARAILYNLDIRVEQQEMALRQRDLSLKRFDMLPQLVASTTFSERDNYRAARSVSISRVNGDERLGEESLRYSTSAERRVFTQDIRLSWDILDFGLSYVRARQASDKVMIALETKRKVINRIVEDVRSAFWRAVSAQRMLNAMQVLKLEVDKALKDSEKLLKRGLVNPMTALADQRDLLGTQEELNELERELTIARHQLAALMNLDPGSHFEIALPDRHDVSLPTELSARKMIELAMVNRPELREITYQQGINEKEAAAALLELLPGINLHADFTNDTNDFLFNQDWVSWGAKTSWNLMNLFRYPLRKRNIEATEDLLHQRALALTMAVMTQIHVSRTRFAFAQIHMENSEKYRSVQHQILDQIRSGYRANRLSRHALLREQMNTLIAELKHDISVATLQNAFANLYAAVGMDAYAPTLTGEESLQEMTEKLQQFWTERGDSHIYIGDRSGLKKLMSGTNIEIPDNN